MRIKTVRISKKAGLIQMLQNHLDQPVSPGAEGGPVSPNFDS